MLEIERVLTGFTLDKSVSRANDRFSPVRERSLQREFSRRGGFHVKGHNFSGNHGGMRRRRVGDSTALMQRQYRCFRV